MITNSIITVIDSVIMDINKDIAFNNITYQDISDRIKEEKGVIFTKEQIRDVLSFESYDIRVLEFVMPLFWCDVSYMSRLKGFNHTTYI